jgi:hypothetical protein
MSDDGPRNYGDAINQARELVNQGRLVDPDEHYPYKHADVSALVEENPPAGPDGPDDDRVRIRDLMSQDIADASRDYIDAQAAYLRDPGDATRGAYHDARDRLITARQAHRANRRSAAVIGFRGAE